MPGDNIDEICGEDMHPMLEMKVEPCILVNALAGYKNFQTMRLKAHGG